MPASAHTRYELMVCVVCVRLVCEIDMHLYAQFPCLREVDDLVVGSQLHVHVCLNSMYVSAEGKDSSKSRE